MIVVADASPLIFLAKIRQLKLLHQVLGQDVGLPRAVHDEILVPTTEPAERIVLEKFLVHCRIEDVSVPQSFARAMSHADNAVLTLALHERADILLCDERLTRIMAEAEGMRALGTLGLLLGAMRRSIISPGDTRILIDRLVTVHNFRIGIEVYQAVLNEIEQKSRE